MFERYTERARKVIILAQDEAVRLKHNYIGTEHLLLGLLREREGIAAKILESLDISIEAVRNELENFVDRTEYQGATEVAFTPRAKRVLELALDETRRLSHKYVGTEHILLGVFREGDGVGAQILRRLGLDIETVRMRLNQILNENSQQQDPFAPTSQSKRESKTPILDEFSRDLTQLAKEGKLDPVIGREREIERVIQILSRRTKNNPVLIGEPGVGKTAIVEGLGQKIIKGEVHEILKNKRVVSLDLAAIVAGTKYRGEFEKRLKKIISEIVQTREVILFIDEVHTLVGAGAAEGAIDAANILKPALARGELQAIGATTITEYRKYIEKDSALERRFQPVYVDEPSVKNSIEILRGIKERYEDHHRVEIVDEALKAAVHLSQRYISDRYLPDKAIDVMDEASSRVRLRATVLPDDLKQMEKEIEETRIKKEMSVKQQDFEEAATLRDLEDQLKRKYRKNKDEWLQQIDTMRPLVTEEDIAAVVANWTGIPVSRLAIEEKKRLVNMDEEIHKRLIGQDEAVKAVSRAIRRSRAGLKDPRRPIGSFIFLGPSGVGKTELGKALAEFLFGKEDSLITLDMSEYMEKHTISRLIGSPPGYIGYDEGGQLTEKVRRHPYSVILFDEIEKASPEIFNILLQILEEGRLTDAQGRQVDFKNTVIIMTSNLGARMISSNVSIGFGNTTDEGCTYEDIKQKVMEEVRRVFVPEFLNRIDELIVFKPLKQEEIEKIVDLMMKETVKRLVEQSITIELTPEARSKIAKEGYDPNFGARPLRRAIQRMVEDPISDLILKGTFKEGDRILIGVEEEILRFDKMLPLELSLKD
ncbi:MAG: Negative regulator of genetic competence ClpC/MecB [Candidatus Atribacteria bacterium ADurb.Bin276]|jgi:ATP-dependent Clp protease ATP-binding subunit ClpC|uniref:Negative regulator of genetic competence ClpC/MecB n=1 Tax=Candidatus Atribacter allofermentans TaxID=1852833 RepID=A0A1V5T2T0_9BACT|nr:MAG: Negative regulator of genetic competence ClpC/MecB [Candidatus Atribacteria bacterium ADurb.Bin276]